MSWLFYCLDLKICLTQPKTGLILLWLWLILDVVIKTKLKKLSSLMGLGACMSLYQMLLDGHYQRCAFAFMISQSVSVVRLLYLDVERKPICFHCYWLHSTAPAKFTQDFADKKEQTLALQESPKASILWAIATNYESNK